MDHAWHVAPVPDQGITDLLMREVRVPLNGNGPGDTPAVFARVLARRGLADPGLAWRYLEPTLDSLDDPRGLVDAEKAARRIDAALERGETMLVHGDYDVDGTTATALLVRVLTALGGTVEHFIPHRIEDGYGLSRKAVDIAVAKGVRLIVTADCGIGAHDPVRYANEKGLECVITDHHEVGATLPPAVAVVNPKRPDCHYSFQDFAGVGVAWKVLDALIRVRGRGDEQHLLEENLDLVALGTIADVVPLQGENRVLAHLGLQRLGRSTKVGVKALLDRIKIRGRRIDSGQVAFAIAPRINAAGRLGDSETPIRLFLSTDEAESQALADKLETSNDSRRKLDETILEEAMALVEAGEAPGSSPLVLWNEGWHSGVLGIVASRLVERYRVPALLLTVEGAVARGSGRSVPGFDLVETLGACTDLLDEWGGHKYAAGLTLPMDRLGAFRERFVATGNPILAALDRRPTLEIEDELPLADCDRTLALLCEKLAPFGYENGEPLFVARGLHLLEAPRRLGDRKQHLRFIAYQDGHTRECIGFGLGPKEDRINHPGQKFSAVFVPTVNRWRGRESIQLKLKDLRPE